MTPDRDGATTRRRRWWSLRTLFVALVAIVALGAAACGDSTSDTAQNAASPTGPVQQNAEQAQSDLSDALRSAGLDSVASAIDGVDVNDVTGQGPYTFFAPNNDAFLSISSNELQNLLKNPTELRDILRNHTLDQKLTRAELEKKDSVTTKDGNTLDVSGSGDNLMVGGAHVVGSEKTIGDGIVYVVDKLFIPQGDQ
jgi:uncharacterized surface protein with fasciclin (FAS1) repeats